MAPREERRQEAGIGRRQISRSVRGLRSAFRSYAPCAMYDRHVALALRRARFDQYGEAGLKQGVPNGRGGTTAGWSLSKHPEAVFADFFGTTSPFAEFGYAMPASHSTS